MYYQSVSHLIIRQSQVMEAQHRTEDLRRTCWLGLNLVNNLAILQESTKVQLQVEIQFISETFIKDYLYFLQSRSTFFRITRIND